MGKHPIACITSRHLPHQLETYTQVIPKVEIVQHVNDVVRSIGIFLSKLIKNTNFDEGLESIKIINS